MADLFIQSIALAAQDEPEYQTAAVFEGDPLLSQLAGITGEALRDAGHPIDRLRFLPDWPDHDVPELALAKLGSAQVAQPIYISRSGNELDPFVTKPAKLSAGRDWVTEIMTLTHLESLTGSAVFEVAGWSMAGNGATVLLVDQDFLARTEELPKPIIAVAMRVGVHGGGVRVGEGGTGTPVVCLGERVFTGTRNCQAWRLFVEAITRGDVARGTVVVLNTKGPGQEGWLRLYIDDLPVLRS